MGITRTQSSALAESNACPEFDAIDRCTRLDGPPCMGEDEEMVENSAGASDAENHLGGDDEIVENSTGRDSIASEGGAVPEQSEDTESESDEVAKTLRFNDLCQRAIKFAEDGATSVNAYRAALGALEKALAEVASAKNGVVVDQPTGSHLSNLITPLTVYDNRRTKTRGRPPSTSRLEPGDEKPEKRTRKCKICKEDGHYMRTCPSLRGSSGKLTDNSEGNLDSSEKSPLVLITGENDSSKKNLVDSASKKLTDRGRRTSNYRGVTRHRWSGKYEVHLWDNSCEREGQTRKGKLVYLGGYDTEEKAARVYDLAALKFWGLDPNLKLNFPISDYEKQLEEVKDMTREEFVTSQRRKSSGFSRGSSIYRGVTRRAHDGKWQARIGPCAGNKDFYYLGTYSSEREAAEAYDVAAIELRGLNAVTNFDITTYCEGGWKELEWFCKLKKLGQGENLKLTQGENLKLTPEENHKLTQG